MLLREEGCGGSALPGQYLSGAAWRPGVSDPGSWVSYKVGAAGGSDAEYGTYGEGAPGEFSSGDRMGRVHGCGDHGV